MSTKKKGVYDSDMNFSIKPSIFPPKTLSAPKTKTLSALKPKLEAALKPETVKPSFFFTTKSKLLTVPPVMASAVASAVANNENVENKSSFLRYMLIFFILGFLGLSLYLYLEKPVDTDIKNLYDPVLNYLGFTTTPAKGAARGAAPAKGAARGAAPAKGAAVDKLEKAVNEKKVINNIDKTDDEKEENIVQIKRDFKKPPVIPKADDSTGQINKPKSKSGFCYIGEDRGFRSCISVEEGDVCMSGDIFPTQAVCINPNLRE